MELLLKQIKNDLKWDDKAEPAKVYKISYYTFLLL